MVHVAWRRCIIGGLAALAISAALIAGVVLAYAFALAVGARGAPDQARIQAFARSVGHAVGPLLRGAAALGVAGWVSRKLPVPVLQGTVVGATAALGGLPFGWPPGARMAIVFLGVLAAGAAGGAIGRSWRQPA